MKICFVSYEYPPLIIGGAGVYAVHMAKELAQLGHEVHVISPGIYNQKGDSVEDDVFVHRVPIIHEPFLGAPSFWFSSLRKYPDIYRGMGGFDVVHGNSGIGDLSFFRWRVKGPRVVTTHHLASTAAIHCSFLDRLSPSLETGFPSLISERHVIHRADRIIAVSNFTKNDLIRTHKIPSSRIEVIYNGVSPEGFVFPKEEILRVRASLHLENEIGFLFVGRVDDYRKGLLLLLKAWELFSRKEKSAKLVVVGPGDQTIAKTHARLLDIEESTVFKGYVGNETLNKIYCACDIFVSPSLLEGFGLTLVEAMAAGKPIIAFRVGAIPEIVKDGFNGKTLGSRDPSEFAKAMEFFTRNPECIGRVGSYNRDYASKRFSWKITAVATERVYEELLSDCAKRKNRELPC